MASGNAILSVVPGILENARETSVRSRMPRRCQMPAKGKRCEPGCTCGLHSPKPCKPGCVCHRHSQPSVKCPDDCTCGRHLGQPKRTRDDRRAQVRESVRRHREANPDSNAATVQRWRDAHPEEARERQRGAKGTQYRLKHLYDMTPERWAQMLAEQDNCCYLCSEPLDLDTPRKIHVDHDHSCCRGVKSCGKCVRGIACEPCNRGIGAFGDDPERMRRVAERLEAAIAKVAANRAVKPVQGEFPIDIKRAARRREESA